jgi:excisionase family DNA binding protein
MTDRCSPPPRLLTVPDVADQVQVSPRTVWRWIADGSLPCVRIGRMVRVDPDALERFLADHATGSDRR